ncbi:MAG: hypothetical protein ACKPKO_24860, partial [Candidatus Fonsibacter sp.]
GLCPKVASSRGRTYEGQQHVEVRNQNQACLLQSLSRDLVEISKLSVGVPINHGPKTDVVWQSGLFVSMATRILQLLAGKVQERKAQRSDPDRPPFGENEMLIFVRMSLCRLLRRLYLCMRMLMSWDGIRNNVDLEGVTDALVNCRQPNDTTGPTFKFGITVSHPRQKAHEPMDHDSGGVANNGDTNRHMCAVHATDTNYPPKP